MDVFFERLIIRAATIDERLSDEFEPDKYRDVYRERLETLIESKLKGKKTKTKAPRRIAATTNVVDIMSKLKESLESGKGTRKTAARGSARKSRTKAA